MVTQQEGKQIKIYFTGDIHSNIPYSIDLVEKMFDFKKDKSSVLIDAGDFFQGSPFFNIFGGNPEKKIYKELYDISIPGNHGFKIAKSLRNKANIVNANIYMGDEPVFRQFQILKRQGMKIGFVGIISKEAFDAIEMKERKGLQFKDPILVFESLVPKLRSKVDAVILVSHSGVEYDKKISREIKGVDVIISSHCHSSFKKNDKLNTKMIKAPEMGMGFGEINIDNKFAIGLKIYKINNKSKLFNKKNLLFFNRYLKKYYQGMSPVVLLVDSNFSNKYDNRKALCKYISGRVGKYFNSDICVINYFCLRDVFKQGNVTKEDVYRIAPLETKLVKFATDIKEFNEIISGIRRETKSSLCMYKNINDGKHLQIITTEYLFNNYFRDCLKDKKYKQVIDLVEFISKYLFKK